MIYIIQSVTGPIKIGLAESPEQRLRDLQVANPYGLILCGHFPTRDDRAFELQAHRVCQVHRLSGEWFRNTKPVCEYVLRLLRAPDAVFLVPPASERVELTIAQENAREQKDARIAKRFLATGKPKRVPIVSSVAAPSFLRLPAVKSRTGLSRSSIYAMMSEGKFPSQVPLGKRAIGFVESEIDEWISQRVEGRNEMRNRRPTHQVRQS